MKWEPYELASQWCEASLSLSTLTSVPTLLMKGVQYQMLELNRSNHLQTDLELWRRLIDCGSPYVCEVGPPYVYVCP